MKECAFECLDFSDLTVREAYERAFYVSFERVISNRLIHTLWAWDYAGQRLATRIRYEDQLVFAMRSPDGGVQAALAFNVAMEKFQSFAFGFLPPVPSEGCFEVLTFFNPENRDLRIKFDLWAKCLRELQIRGFHTGYTTTAARPLRLYLRIGWELIEEKEIAGEKRFFLRYRMPQSRHAGSYTGPKAAFL